MIARIGFLLVLVAAALTGSIDESRAEKRVALVIGNSAYRSVANLANPASDAAAMTGLFRGAGFDVVEMRRDMAAIDLRRTLRDFANTVRDADIAVVYYAGHGIEVDGTNYLIPVDARLEADVDVEDEAVSVDRILRMLDPVKRLRLVILDACRENPFGKNMKRLASTRAIGRGLAQVEPATTNTLIAFAAKAGSFAIDGDGANNSPFTTALLKHLASPGLDLRIAFGQVRDEVMKATNNRQEPFVYGSLGGGTLALVPAADPARATAPASTAADIRRDYEMAERIGTKEAWNSFIARYASGFYVDLAKASLTKLQAAEPARSETPVTASKSAVAPEIAKTVNPSVALPDVPKPTLPDIAPAAPKTQPAAAAAKTATQPAACAAGSARNARGQCVQKERAAARVQPEPSRSAPVAPAGPKPIVAAPEPPKSGEVFCGKMGCQPVARNCSIGYANAVMGSWGGQVLNCR